ncbi:MAG TPA: pyridoxamine 5'-phosphate oxidase family protein [Thermoplasmata archaeon]|nr:pyridoxamine 5'-phosphate oxidase family protein [Thermoplasmata archaeon]
MGLRVVSARWSDLAVRRSVLQTLAETPLGALATSGPRGRAHVNTAYFAYSPRLEIVFLSEPTSEHMRNLARSPSAGFAVFRSDQRWGGSDRGLQLFGRGAVVADSMRPAAEAIYARRFPLYREAMRSRSPRFARLAAGLRELVFGVVQPREIKLLDERRFPGRLVTLRLPSGRSRGIPTSSAGRVSSGPVFKLSTR